MKRVQGDLEQAKPLIVGKDTVYIHSNIVQVEEDLYEYDEGLYEYNKDLYEYDEIQYPKDEYIAKIGAENSALRQDQLTMEDTIAELVMMQYV